MTLNGPLCFPQGTGAHCFDAERWENGKPRRCSPDAECYVKTSAGGLRPRCESEYPRRPDVDPVSFHRSGALARISLTSTLIATPIGALPAELLLFYEDGGLRRLFPQDGTLDAYWDEAQEYALAPLLEIPTPAGVLRARFIAIAFYPSGELFSLTLWPGEVVSIETPAGRLDVRTGVSFYPGGAVQSVEPRVPTVVDTPIGKVTAFDPEPIGVSGDRNSLAFDADGRLASVVTSVESFDCQEDGGKVVRHAPDSMVASSAEEMTSSYSIRITFLEGLVRVQKGPYLRREYPIDRVRVHRPPYAGRRHLAVLR